MWFMIKVTFGEHDRCNDNNRPESRFVLRAIAGAFSFLNFDNDIALLRLNDRVPITDRIRPICLPTNKSKTNIQAIVSEFLEISQENFSIFLNKHREKFYGKFFGDCFSLTRFLKNF